MAKVKVEEDGKLTLYCPACRKTHVIFAKPNQWGAPVFLWNGRMDLPDIFPSVRIRVGHGDEIKMDICHFFVQDGKIKYTSDSTHELAGKIVDLPDMEAR